MAVPTNNTWRVWDDQAGTPTGNVDLLIDTYTASYCDGTTLRTVDIELRLKTVNRTTYNENGIPITEYRQVISAIPTGAVVGASSEASLEIKRASRSSYDTRPNAAGEPWGEFLNYTEHTFTFDFSNFGVAQEYPLSGDFPLEVEPDGQDEFETLEYRQDTLWGLPVTVVSCAAPPPSCTLGIATTTIFPETFSGDADGSITVFVSGSTGTTTYYLNNANPQTGNTFSGLTAGIYSVQVEEDLCFDEVTGLVVGAGEFRTAPFTVTEPSTFLASENPIITTLRTATNGAPQFAQTRFQVASNIVDGTSLTFNLTNPIAYTATFTAKDFPNRSNYFTTRVLKNRLGINIGTQSTAECATTLAEAISKDIVLSRYYFIDVDDDKVFLTAKQATALLTLDSSNTTISGNGLSRTLITEGQDQYEGSVVSDYSLFTDVYVGAAGTQYGDTLSAVDYDNYTSLQLPYSQDNIHRFDVSDVMKNFVSTPKIDLTFTGFTYITSMIRPFFIKYGEAYPLVINENTKKRREKGDTGYKWVLNSSLEFEQANDVSQYFTGGSFLTNAPNPLQVQRNQTSFLYFILEKDQGSVLTLKGDIDYYDGTSQTGQTFINISTGTTNLGGVYCLNTSYEALGLAAYEASGNTKIKRVTFGVYADDVLFSEQRTYRFEIDEQPRKFGVSFLNKLGAYDTFDFVGVVEDSIERVNKNYTIPRQVNSDGSSPVGFKNTAMYDTQVTKTITVNSGWIDEDHFNWLIELMNTNDIYSYTEDNQNYLNVIAYKYTKSSLDEPYELEVTFKLTIFENTINV